MSTFYNPECKRVVLHLTNYCSPETRDEIVVCILWHIIKTQVKSQWIVRQAHSQHLQYLDATRSSAKDVSPPKLGIGILMPGNICATAFCSGARQICLYLLMWQWRRWVTLLSSMDSDLEAFSHNPTDGSFAALAFQLAAFTKYLNQLFLSY